MQNNVFLQNEDISKNAYLNWRMNENDIADNYACMANCYSNAVIILFKSILGNNVDNKADALIFPILFSISHVIELYLKAIILEITEFYGSSRYSGE